MSLADPSAAPSWAPGRPPALAAYGLAVGLVALATFGAVGAGELGGAVPSVSLIFVLPVVICAVSVGAGPALAAAVLGALAYNFFLLPPLYTLRVAEPANVWALTLLLAVAVIVSAVAAQARRRALDARAAVRQAEALQALARRLVAAIDEPAIAAACAEALCALFACPAVVLGGEDEPALLAVAGRAEPAEADLEAAAWAAASRLPTRAGAYPLEAAAFDFWPVVTPQRRRAVVGLAFPMGDPGRPAAPERLVEVVLAYLAVALDRDHYARAALAAAHERLKTDLLAAVSHDLKTPLSTVLVTLQSLQRFKHAPQARAELLDAAERETARLSGMVDNLLAMNRLDAGAVTVRAAPAPAALLVAHAQAHAAAALAGHPLDVALEPTGPVLEVDPALFTVALGNVLENAGRYSPAGAPIHLRAGAADRLGWIEVADEGPGFPTPVAPLFERFARGVSGDGRPPGVGLGLAIAKGFVEAQGGRIEARNRAGGGGLVRLYAPLARGRA